MGWKPTGYGPQGDMTDEEYERWKEEYREMLVARLRRPWLSRHLGIG